MELPPHTNGPHSHPPVTVHYDSGAAKTHRLPKLIPMVELVLRVLPAYRMPAGTNPAVIEPLHLWVPPDHLYQYSPIAYAAGVPPTVRALMPEFLSRLLSSFRIYVRSLVQQDWGTILEADAWMIRQQLSEAFQQLAFYMMLPIQTGEMIHYDFGTDNFYVLGSK